MQHAVRSDDVGRQPAAVQSLFPTMLAEQDAKPEHLFEEIGAYEIVRSSQNTIAACDVVRAH